MHCRTTVFTALSSSAVTEPPYKPGVRAALISPTSAASAKECGGPPPADQQWASVVIVAMCDGPDLKPNQADQYRAEGDERRQPPLRMDDSQRRHREGIGDQQECDQHRPDRRPTRLRSSAGALDH